MCELTAEQTYLKSMLAYQETMLLFFYPDSERVLMAIQLMVKAVSYPFDPNSSQPEYDGSIVDLEALHIQLDSGRIDELKKIHRAIRGLHLAQKSRMSRAAAISNSTALSNQELATKTAEAMSSIKSHGSAKLDDPNHKQVNALAEAISNVTEA
jgi:hypothetical protein